MTTEPLKGKGDNKLYTFSVRLVVGAKSHITGEKNQNSPAYNFILGNGNVMLNQTKTRPLQLIRCPMLTPSGINCPTPPIMEYEHIESREHS